MNILFLLLQNPGNGGGSPACGTPNPPFWCEDAGNPQDAPIDQYIYVMIFIAIVVVLLNFRKRLIKE